MPDVDGGKTVRIIMRSCSEQLVCSAFIEWVATTLCTHMGMTPRGDPVTRSVKPGLSCCLIIIESHIAIHTWPETSSVRVVIDSCVDFDHGAAAEWLKGVFGAGSYDCCIV